MGRHKSEEELEEGQLMVADKPEGIKGANEFGEDYTMEVISDNEPGADMFRVPYKDPNFAYRFLRDDKDNMSVKTSNLLLSKGGWQVVPIRHLTVVNKIDKKLLQPDGSYKVGSLILAFMPMKLFLKKEAEDRRKTNEAMAGVKSLVEEGDQSRIQIKDVNAIQPGRMDGGRIVFDKKAKGSIKTITEVEYGSHNAVEQ
jgi:hypothetical protein